MPNHLPLDGLTDEEFQYRYELACELQNYLSPGEALSAILDLISRRDDLGNRLYTQATEQEAERDWLDLADWFKLLHELHYKPGWKAELQTLPVPISNNWLIRLHIEVVVETPEGKRPLSSNVVITPDHINSEKRALWLVENIIRECEREIFNAWFTLRGEAVIK